MLSTHTHAARPWPIWSTAAFRRQRPAVCVGSIALAVSILAGSTFNAFAKTLTNVLSPLSLLFVSEVITAFFVLFTFGAIPTLAKVARAVRSRAFPLLAIGSCSGIFGPLLWFTGLQGTTAVNAALFGKADTIFLILLGHALLRERVTAGHMLSGLTIGTGIVSISLRGFQDGIALQPGDLLILLATFSYAAGNIIFRKYLQHIDPHVALFVRSSTAILTFFLLSPFIEHPFIAEAVRFPAALLPALIGFGFLSRFLNSFSFYVAIDRLSVTTVSLVSTLETIGSALFAALYLRESLHWYHLFGGTLIVLGTILIEYIGAQRIGIAITHPLHNRLAHKP